MGPPPPRSLGGGEVSLKRPDGWARRLRRIGHLLELWPFSAEILGFYRTVTSFQRDLHGRLRASKAPPFDAATLAAGVPPLLELVEREGPSELASVARGLRERTPEEWEQSLETFWGGKEGDAYTEAFFPRVILQPVALVRAERGAAPAPSSDDAMGTCPHCDRPPVVSVLREDREADTTRRFLVCSLCGLEWNFPRVLCPGCREERPDKLSRFTSEEIPWIRV